MKFFLLLATLAALATNGNTAQAFDLSPDGPAARAAVAASLGTVVPDFDKSYKRNRIMQITGYALLGTSAVLTIVGAAMVQGSPWGPVARAGIISFGVGLAHFITASFLLGFSQVIINQELPSPRPVKIIHKSAQCDCEEGDIYF